MIKSSRRVWETLVSVQVVEELLSRSGALGKETAKSIADAAMLEVAGISMGHMVPDQVSVRSVLCGNTPNVPSTLPTGAG